MTPRRCWKPPRVSVSTSYYGESVQARDSDLLPSAVSHPGPSCFHKVRMIESLFLKRGS